MVPVAMNESAYGTIHEAGLQGEKSEILTLPTEEAVRTYFKDIPVLVEVARCESTFRHTLKDGSVLKGRVDSDDTGVMQINKRYHSKDAESLGLDLNNLYDNMAYARDLYLRQGTKPWSASAPCWSKELAVR